MMVSSFPPLIKKSFCKAIIRILFLHSNQALCAVSKIKQPHGQRRDPGRILNLARAQKHLINLPLQPPSRALIFTLNILTGKVRWSPRLFLLPWKSSEDWRGWDTMRSPQPAVCLMNTAKQGKSQNLSTSLLPS